MLLVREYYHYNIEWDKLLIPNQIKEQVYFIAIRQKQSQINNRLLTKITSKNISNLPNDFNDSNKLKEQYSNNKESINKLLNLETNFKSSDSEEEEDKSNNN